MKIEIEISDDKLQNLSQSANEELEKATKCYVEDILDEAGRIEESRRITNSTPEITAAIIDDAVAFAKYYGIRKKKNKKKPLIVSTAFFSTLLTGLIFNRDDFENGWYILLFLIIFFIAIASNLFLIFGDNSDE